jgi:ubiquinone/menaquinone biosynthesis C-methylase UbiE
VRQPDPVTDYLHGYSDEERARLRIQANVLAPFVHRNLPFAHRRRLLEVGCGTGAQLELLLDAFPTLHVTGVDHAAVQLAAAAQNLAAPAHALRTTLVEAPAERLPFDHRTFDAAFLCWILEHVEAPATVLRELHRVLEPDAPVVITEVMNATFHLVPPSPHTMRYWAAFNAHQLALRGDPYVGARLGHLLHHAGFRDIETTAREVIFDDRDAPARAAFCIYCKNLLLSAAPSLLAAALVDQAEIDAMSDELDAIGRGPGSIFFYAFVQARCRA